MNQYKPYAEYKESGVDWMPSIPSHWSTSSIGHQVTFNPRPTLGEKRANPRVTFLPMSAVGTDGSLELTDTRQFSDLDGSYTFFREGDLCFAKVTPCFENGKGAVLTGLSAGMGFGSSELTVVTPKKPEQVNILKYYLVLQPFRQLGTSWMSGTAGLQRVPDLFAKSFPFFAAPLPEQQAIANFLDRETEKIDALINQKTRLIELLEEKRQATISHAVTKGLNPDAPMKDSGVPWLGDIPEHWALSKFAWVCRLRMGETILSEELTENGDIPVYSATAEDQFFGRVSGRTPLLNPGDLVVPARGASIGYVKYVTELATATQTTIILTNFLPSIEPSFAFFWCLANRANLFEYDHTAIPQITVAQIKTKPIIIPSVEEQSEIALELAKTNGYYMTIMFRLSRSIALLREKRSALITAAVTGQIDVREEVLG